MSKGTTTRSGAGADGSVGAGVRKPERRQINMRVDDDFMAALEVIQRAHSPLLDRSEAVRVAILAHARELSGRKR